MYTEEYTIDRLWHSYLTYITHSCCIKTLHNYVTCRLQPIL